MAGATNTAPRHSIAEAFAAVLTADVVSDAADLRQALSGDIAAQAPRPADVIIAPRREDDVVVLVETARQLGVALYPRGGGYSYTAGFRPDAAATAIVDMRNLRGVDIGEGCVRVAAGETWAAVYDALKAHKLRVPSFGPLSGLAATIGGSLAQNGGFFGTASYGAYTDGTLLGSTIIDGRAERVVFTDADTDGFDWPQPLGGDCGAFGIRTAAELRTIDLPACEAFASFHFSSQAEGMAGLVAVAGIGGIAEAYLFDPGTHANLAATGFSIIESAGIASDIIGSRGSLLQRFSGLFRTARAGKAFVADLAYSLHIAFEGDRDDVDAAQEETAHRLRALGAEIIPDVIPRVTRAKPFRQIKAVLGPAGERWLPVHGIVGKQDAPAVAQKLRSCLNDHADVLRQHGVRVVVLATCSKDNIIIEPQFFWRELARSDATPFGSAQAVGCIRWRTGRCGRARCRPHAPRHLDRGAQ